MNILIVESKAKCRTLLKHLGSDEWRVLPTGGHVQRLAEDRTLHPPKEVKKAYWSHSAGQLPDPPWFWTERGEAAVRAIRDEAAKHDSVTFYLAADPDREGELIAWHLQRLLADLGPCRRVTFQEVTREAVLAAVAAPRELDQALIDAALIRTFIDRVVGWRASKIAKRYTTSSVNSMGRVQTPTLGFVVERELEREAHVPVRYFEVHANTDLTDWRVRFHEKADAEAWVDEKNTFHAHRTADAKLAEDALAALRAAGSVEVRGVERRTKAEAPRPPFSTDTLLQAAGSRWGWSPKKTAALAGQLYEAGHITYIRTDSTRLAAEAVEAGRNVVRDTWGDGQFAAEVPWSAASDPGSVEPATRVQDAHEAIRPTDLALSRVPDVEADVQKLYALVRARTLAALMLPSQRVTLSLTGSCDGLERVLSGSVGWYAELGWRQAFAVDGLDTPGDTEPRRVEVGTVLALLPGDEENPNPLLREDRTKPPARYRAHTLVKAMKDAGIGRPSTYAKTVERLEDRGYVSVDGGALVPTESGRNIWLEAAPLYALPERGGLFETDYTAAMEDLLDRVAAGRRDASEAWETMLEEFRSAHDRAQEGSVDGPLWPRTRQALEGFIEAAPELRDELGDLATMTQAQGRALLDDLKTRGITLLPSAKQRELIEKLLESTGSSLEAAVERADLKPAGEQLSREEASALIESLKREQSESRAPTPKQLRWIADLAKKAGLDEAGACALVGRTSYAELTGGQEGTASALIDGLRERARDAAKGSARAAEAGA